MAWSSAQNYFPLSATNASSMGLAAWTCDPTMAPATPGVSSGYIYFCRTYIDLSVACTHAWFCLINAGVTVSNSYLGVYQPGVGGLLLAKTSDVSSSLTTTPSGPLEFSFSSTPTATLPAMNMNTEIWLAILLGSQGTQPTFVGRSSYGTNIGMSSDYRMWMTTANSYTSLPSTVPSGIAVSTAGQSIPFIGIGP